MGHLQRCIGIRFQSHIVYVHFNLILSVLQMAHYDKPSH